MTEQNKRRSERVIPFVSDEEVVILHQSGQPNLLAKMMDLSDVGTLLYLLADGDLTGSVGLSIYHQGKVMEVPARAIRTNGRLVAFEFTNLSPEVLRHIQTKLIRMEIDWSRLSRLT